MSWWFHKCCAGEPECECECECCQDDKAPCCWKVVISGMAEGDCGDCAGLDGTYYLAQDADDDCTWSNSSVCLELPCDPKSISLSVTCDGDTDYKIAVSLGSHVWEKDYGNTAPDCCNLADEELTHTTSSGDCDSSSATCVITAQNTACGTLCCDEYCEEGEAPSSLTVTVSGIADGTCYHCDCFNYTFTLGIVSPCHWECDNAVVMPCPLCPDYIGKVVAILGAGVDPGTYRLTVTIEDTSSNVIATYRVEWEEKPDCLAWANLALALVSQSWSICDLSGSSVVVNSDQGGGTGGQTFDDDLCILCDDCGTTPESLRVDITGTTDGLACTECDELNKTWILSRIVECEGTRCVWTAGVGICAGPNEIYTMQVHIRAGFLWFILYRGPWYGSLWLARGHTAIDTPTDCQNLDVTVTIDEVNWPSCSFPISSVHVTAA